MIKGGKFLKKLGCCIGGIAEQGSLVLSAELIAYIWQWREFKSWHLEHQPFIKGNDKGLVLEMSAF